MEHFENILRISNGNNVYYNNALRNQLIGELNSIISNYNQKLKKNHINILNNLIISFSRRWGEEEVIVKIIEIYVKLKEYNSLTIDLVICLIQNRYLKHIKEYIEKCSVNYLISNNINSTKYNELLFQLIDKQYDIILNNIDILPINESTLDVICRTDKVELLEYINMQKYSLTDNHINKIITNNAGNCFKYVIKEGILDIKDKDTKNIIMHYNPKSELIYDLLFKYHKPNKEDINKAIMSNNLHVLINNGYIPTDNELKKYSNSVKKVNYKSVVIKQFNRSTEMIEYILNRNYTGYYYDYYNLENDIEIKETSQLDALCGRLNKSTLVNYINKGIYPSVEGLKNALRLNNTYVVNELIKFGLHPTIDCFDNCNTVTSFRKMIKLLPRDLGIEHNKNLLKEKNKLKKQEEDTKKYTKEEVKKEEIQEDFIKETYIYKDENTEKFWEITYLPEGGDYKVKFGKVGNDGRTINKIDNINNINSLIQSKKEKGYKLKESKKENIVISESNTEIVLNEENKQNKENKGNINYIKIKEKEENINKRKKKSPSKKTVKLFCFDKDKKLSFFDARKLLLNYIIKNKLNSSIGITINKKLSKILEIEEGIIKLSDFDKLVECIYI